MVNTMINLTEYTIPKLPGVYIFKDIYNTILYIGKAKNLHNRIASYSTDRQIDWKLESLLKQSQCIEWIITETEKAALLLEAELISEQKPLFNKLLTSDNPFNYIIFRKKNNISTIEITRYYTKKNDLIVGPFLNKKEAIDLYEYILSFFNLFICKKKISNGCLNYHIGKCAGSCKDDFDAVDYKKRYLLAKAALKNQDIFLKILEKNIKQAKKNFNYNELEKLITYKLEYNELFYKINQNINTYNEDSINRILLNITIENTILKEACMELKDLLSLKITPSVIDCIDISHFQGHATTGACIRFIDGKYDTIYSKSYALPFNQNNDYENLQLLVKSHYQYTPYPDILLIDGGKGQLHTIEKLHLPISLLSLAKKEETLFTQNHPQGIKITAQNPYGKLLLALRNTTHNAAIRLHRKSFNQYYK